jgi:glycosyltransferase involved in cell wall biosynthesis
LKISIIIPVYGVEVYLERCLDSICNQSYTDLEIILVDDGPPDRCSIICDEWATKDGNRKIIRCM